MGGTLTAAAHRRRGDPDQREAFERGASSSLQASRMSLSTSAMDARPLRLDWSTPYQHCISSQTSLMSSAVGSSMPTVRSRMSRKVLSMCTVSATVATCAVLAACIIDVDRIGCAIRLRLARTSRSATASTGSVPGGGWVTWLASRSTCAAITPVNRCTFDGKYRYRVPIATPAAFATSCICTRSSGFSAPIRDAARRMRRRRSCCSGEVGSAESRPAAILATVVSPPGRFLARHMQVSAVLTPNNIRSPRQSREPDADQWDRASPGPRAASSVCARRIPRAGGRHVTWDDEYDVVVAGSGAGAMAGALAAASAGLRTAVLEKTGLLGGTSAYSGAAIWLPGTRVQERAGLGDSAESARTYLRALLGDDGAAHREAFLETAPGLVDFLEADPAIEFEFQPFPDYFAAPGRLDMGRSFVPLPLPVERLGDRAALVRPPVDRDRTGRGHSAGPMAQGRALIGRLLLALDATGNGDVRTGTALTGLSTSADGRVVGVEARTAGGTVRLRARRGVLLAAGGFESSAALRARHGVPGGADRTMAPAGANTGDAIEAAVRIGAAAGRLDQAWFCPGLLTPGGQPAFTL